MHRRNSSYQVSPPSSPSHPPHQPGSPAPPPAPPPPPPPGTPTDKVAYSNAPGRVGKLNQIVQNFFAKGAQIIIQSRINVTPTYQRGTTTKRTNKWFHMELDDTETLRNELSPFRTATFSPPPATPHPPLILEVTLDTRELTHQQTLILVSSQTGQRYTVEKPSNRWLRGSEIVLERWRIDLVTPPKQGAPDLPVVYKKAVVLFRRVFTQARLLPVWKLKKRLGKTKLNNSLKVRVRVAMGDTSDSNQNGRIGISVPLVDAQAREKITDEFSFGRIDTPAGAFDISVAYRLETDFRVTDSEALLSSQFLHLDSSQSSLPGSTSSSPRPRPYPGVDQSQAYGSLSSFHTIPPVGQTLSSSPLTALRNAPYMGTGGPSTPPGQITTPYVHGRSPSQTSLSRLKDASSLPRRPSVTFMQPFKVPSLSSSPSYDVPPSPRPGSTRSSSGVVGRPSSLKESFTPQAFTALEDDTPPPSPSLEGERRRYSSSFSARRERRESFHSGRESRLSTDVTRRRFSGISISSKPEENEQGSVSSGSLRGEEEEDVGLFLRMVECRRELKTTGNSTQSDLDRFRGLRDGYGALGDSVSGSIYIPRASPPAATIARSIGSGESPHTPVVRSRLSEGVSLMEETAKQANLAPRREQTPIDDQHVEERTLKVPTTTEGLPGGAKPLDIPNSPSIRSWGGAAQLSHHRATSFNDHRLARHQQQEQEISNQLLEDELDSRRHSSSLGSLEGIPADQPTFHRRKSSNESAGRGRARPSNVRGNSSSSRGTPRSSVVGDQSQGSLRDKFYSAFAGGEEGDEGEELLFAMSDMMGDKR